MSKGPDPTIKLNLTLASVMLIDSSQHGLDILSQMVKGFGAQDVHRCATVEEADRVVRRATVDLILADPILKEGDGFEFLRWLRNSGPEGSRYAPIILISGHASPANVGRARDVGANFFVVKPLSPKVLIERILWIDRDKRPFVKLDSGYCGPCRRFKFDGPPPGTDGRRSDDLKTPLGEASEPNMSQNEIDSLIKPQKVML